MLTARILAGDCLGRLRELPAGSVHCCVTSPPYYGLRDYGTATWEGGDAGCGHVEQVTGASERNTLGPNGNLPQSNAAAVAKVMQYRSLCGKCGARRIDKQLGLEDTPAAYVARLVEVFNEVARVLREDGTCWLNLGDSYCGMGGHTCLGETSQRKGRANVAAQHGRKGIPPGGNVKSKDLLDIPWQVAFALRDAGWYLRAEVIWAKPSPMPESVRDRPTRAHEQVFLLSRRLRYFYDSIAVQEGFADDRMGNPGNYDNGYSGLAGRNDSDTKGKAWNTDGSTTGRNLRSVWTLSSTPFPGSHFATMPITLAERCVKAGTSLYGCCGKCGAPWVRVVERERKPTRPAVQSKVYTAPPVHPDSPVMRHNGDVCGNRDPQRHCTVTETTGWRPSCRCPDAPPVPCTVLDPFGGAGTTALAAANLGRDSIVCELNRDYCEMARRRVSDAVGLVCQVAIE